MRSSSRDRILDAAEAVVADEGVAHLTLAGAAARAGVSKGGVLYHFPTRGALVGAMVQRMVDAFDRDVEAAVRPGPGGVTHAYVDEFFASGPDQGVEGRSWAAVLAAMASEPALLQPLQASMHAWQQRLEHDGVDPARATAVRLAVDGLWLCELFGIAALTPQMRSAVEAELKALVTP